GGSIAVASDELFGHAALLGLFEARVTGWAQRAAGLHEGGGLGFAGFGLFADEPDGSLARAELNARRAAEEARRLEGALLSAAEAYGRAESIVTASWNLGAQLAGWTAGRALPFFALGALGALAMS